MIVQDVAPRVERGLREFLLPSTTSAPYVEADRLYYVTAECQLRCLDTQGFSDGENDGPYREEVFKDNAAADKHIVSRKIKLRGNFLAPFIRTGSVLVRLHAFLENRSLIRRDGSHSFPRVRGRSAALPAATSIHRCRHLSH